MKPSFILESPLRLDHLFQTYPHNPALITPDRVLSFEDVERRVRSLCATLTRIGISKGNRVALHHCTSELHLYLSLASWVLDFLYIPLDFKAPLSGLLSDAPIDFLITNAKLPPDTDIIVIDLATLLPPCDEMDSIRPWPEIPFEQEASAIFTSGSTGRPRGIVHTVGNTIYSALGTNTWIGLEASDRWLLSLPLFHVGGALIWIRTLLAGAASILPVLNQPLDASIRLFSPTVLSLVPAQLMRLIENDVMVDHLKSMKAILLGGAPLPEWLIDRSLALGLPIMPTYGCTESCAQVSGVALGSAKTAYRTVGRPIEYRRLRVCEDGRIRIGGKTLFKRYLHEPHPPLFDAEGFFTTADSGKIDDAGNLVIYGRTDDVFICGGENISPVEIEQSLLKLDGIVSARIVAIPHREFGLTPWAFVETQVPFDESVILCKLREILPGYKLPKRIIQLTPEDRQDQLKYSREALTQLATRLANVPGLTQLHYEAKGPPDAPVIVFLHGFMGRATSWMPIMEKLSGRFRCIAFDLPGHGLSLFTTHAHLKKLQDMPDTARLILDDLNTLGITHFALYGYSMGGRLAQHITIASPANVSRLILESASFGIADPHARDERLKRDQDLFSRIDTPDTFLAFLQDWYAMPLFQTLSGTSHLQTLIEEKRRHPVFEYRQALNLLSVGRHDFLAEKLAASFVPVHYFCGEKDDTYRQTASQTRRNLPDMTITIFPNASHNISLQYPEEIARAISEILI